MKNTYDSPPYLIEFKEQIKRAIQENPDLTEIDIVMNEIKVHKEQVSSYDSYPIDEQWTKEAKNTAIEDEKKYIQFLEYRLDHLKLESAFNSVNPNADFQSDHSIVQLEWTANEIDLAELLKALCENNCFGRSSDKEVFEMFSKFLNVDIDKKEKLKNIRARVGVVKEKDVFLKTLSQKLISWIDGKDEDKHYK